MIEQSNSKNHMCYLLSMCYTLQLFQVKTFRFVNVQLFIKLAVIGGGQTEGRNQKICLMSTLQTGKLDYISWGLCRYFFQSGYQDYQEIPA